MKIQLRGIIYFPIIYYYRTFKRNFLLKKNNFFIKKNIISILCPSRGRPDKILRLINGLNEKTTYKDRVELMIYVDNDDVTSSKYEKIVSQYNQNTKNNIKVKLIVGEPKSISISWNDLAKNSSGDILMMGNDDCMFTTKDWDIILDDEVNKFPDEIYCIWFDDGMRSYMYGDFPIVSKKWFNILGYFTPGCFEFTFNDVWIIDLATRLGRIHYVKRIKVPHLHADKGLSQKDTTWERHRTNTSSGVFKRDEKKYYDLVEQRIKDAKKLMKYMNK